MNASPAVAHVGSPTCRKIWLKVSSSPITPRSSAERRAKVINAEGEFQASTKLAEAAVVSVRHPKWDERPLLVVVKKRDAELTREEMLKFFEGKVATWWIPDDVVFVLPKSDRVDLTGANVLQTAKLLMACTPNGI